MRIWREAPSCSQTFVKAECLLLEPTAPRLRPQPFQLSLYVQVISCLYANTAAKKQPFYLALVLEAASCLHRTMATILVTPALLGSTCPTCEYSTHLLINTFKQPLVYIRTKVPSQLFLYFQVDSCLHVNIAVILDTLIPLSSLLSTCKHGVHSEMYLHSLASKPPFLNLISKIMAQNWGNNQNVTGPVLQQ